MVRLGLSATYVARAHTALASAAFIVALSLGLLYHYKKLCKNGIAGYPEEFFPSVSSTIGDWYPERNLFQILIAFTSGPRVGLVLLEYLLHSEAWHNSNIPTVIFISGIIRTIACGGWVFITSYDHHFVHDFWMISYMVLNIPWMLGCIVCAPVQTRRRRVTVASIFFLSIIPLVYFYLQHKVHEIPGAYTYYSFFEWSLIFWDIFFDSYTEDELRCSNLQIFVGDSSLSLQPVANSEDTNASKNEPEAVKDSGGEPQVFKESVPELASKSSQSRFSLKFRLSLPWRPAVSFVSSVYLSYIFWSIFTSLIPTLFYFSVWELGISGQELALLSTLSPIFLSVGPLLSWARSRDGSTTLHGLSLIGLTAFILDKPVYRLGLVFFASAAVMIQRVTSWTATDVEYQSILTGLGLLLSSLLKHANHSNNPVWPFVNSKSGGYNITGLLLALLAVYEHHSRPSIPSPTASTEQENLKAKPKAMPASANVSFQGHWLTGALPLGSLIFTLHSLLSDSSTLISWSWTGYINSNPQGPLPHLHGSLTFIAQSIGLLLALTLISSNAVDVLAHPLWFLYGSAAATVLYAYRNWLGYTGGLNLAVFIMSIIPIVFKRASDAAGTTGQSTGKVYFAAMLVYCLLGLASIWTVAYAFVPGGVYLRERTDLVMILQMACLSPAFQWPYLNRSTLPAKKDAVPHGLLSYSRNTLACFSIASLLVTMYRTPTGFPQPFKPGPRILTAGIWTVHFGMDNEGRDSQRLIRDVVRDMELDVIGLLETDLHRIVFGNRDLTRVLVEEMGYYVDVGPGAASHTWGAALLSKARPFLYNLCTTLMALQFPIINSTHHLLPSPNGELAPAIEAVLDVFGTHVTVVVAHNGQEEDPLDRELQSAELARIMAATHPRPVLFLGYVVTKPHAPRPAPYEILVTDGQVFDIDKDDLDRWCEYILYRGLYRTSYARISRGKVTDTELQIGQFVLPSHGTSINPVDESEEARYLRSWKEDLPEDHWFPMSYYEYNTGQHGHYYHVFGTPLYYKIPTAKDPPL
ncbi:Frag1/DRAM/Sfk1 family-domain-containing protein [Mycena maculata]|uniref:Frag1/DRAM/Sfk1 family-domain-containing protein n=1 Tax=Mycena maculata TaxID=230809 RepID=A0AAD7HLB2_9AGAR|nr:Frag1/DRAM/Sfk1 family-domain-containing protein [Mycena maculata]